MNDMLEKVKPSKPAPEVSARQILVDNLPYVHGAAQHRIKELWGNNFRVNYHDAVGYIIESYFLRAVLPRSGCFQS